MDALIIFIKDFGDVERAETIDTAGADGEQEKCFTGEVMEWRRPF